jgi:hypothetical protein
MFTLLLIPLRALAFALGLLGVIGTCISALRTFVLPRSAPDRISRFVFIGVRALFELRKKRLETYAQRDRAMELYAPISLIVVTA